MSSGRTTVAVFVTALIGLLLLIVGLYMHWPLWAWPVAAAGVAAVPVAVLRTAAAPPEVVPPPRRLEPDLPFPPEEKWEQRVENVALPSALSDYDFRFSALVRWRPAARRVSAGKLGGRAVCAVLDRARLVTATQPPDAEALARAQLERALSTLESDDSGCVEVMADEVVLALAEEDRARLHRLAELRKKQAMREHERELERSERRYLGGDVLKDTGSAVVWRLAQDNADIGRVVNEIGTLAQLSSAANNTDVPERYAHLLRGTDPRDGADGADGAAPEDGAGPAPHPGGPGAGGGDGHGPAGAGAGEHPDGPPDPSTAAGGRPAGAAAVQALLDAMGLDGTEESRTLVAHQVADVLRGYGREHLAEEVEEHFDAPAPEQGEACDPEDGGGAGDASGPREHVPHDPGPGGAPREGGGARTAGGPGGSAAPSGVDGVNGVAAGAAPGAGTPAGGDAPGDRSRGSDDGARGTGAAPGPDAPSGSRDRDGAGRAGRPGGAAVPPPSDPAPGERRSRPDDPLGLGGHRYPR